MINSITHATRSLHITRWPLRGFLLLCLLLPVVACGGASKQPVVVETLTPDTIVVTSTPDPNADEPDPGDGTTVPTPEPGTDATDTAVGAFTTPHPLLGDIRVRHALAYCTDRSELATAAFPFLSEEQRQALLMDSFVPDTHWAYAADAITIYPFDPEQGRQLLEEAGWIEQEGENIRVNAEGDPLNIKLLTTEAQFRVEWTSLLEQQLLENCGIQLIRTHAPASVLFGLRSGLQVRDFELAAFTWLGQVNPGGYTLYACNQIPLPDNNWEGQNSMGWCNKEASKAILAASNTSDRQRQLEYYATFQREFTADMVSLPLFNTLEAVAASLNVQNIQADPTIDSFTANIHEWKLADGGDTLIIGVSQEPTSLFLLVEDSLSAAILAGLLVTRAATSYDYDYQTAALTELPTLENGGAVNETIEVREGDIVWSTESEPVELAPGMEVWGADGEAVVYEGGTLEMRQLSVTFEFVEGLLWEDGVPVTKEDFELLYTVDCHPESGSISYTFCDSIADVEFTSDTAYTITYLPGVQWPDYSVQTLGFYANLYTVGAYPAHHETSDGRTLAEVDPSEWSTLPEVVEQPLSYGPYRLIEWEKGQRMVFEANPNYYAGEPQIKNVIVQFFADSNVAVAQLLTGEIDVLGNDTLFGGTELQAVIEASEAGRIQAFPYGSASWEHLDMNLFVP